MIRRPPRSTQSRSSAASDVYKRQGLKAAQMTAGSVTAATLEADLGVATGTLAHLVSSPTSGSAVSTIVFLTAQQTIHFDWDFVAPDFQDFAFFTANGTAMLLADAAHLQGSTGPGTTGWQTGSFTASTTGYYTLGFGVINVGDNKFSSSLIIDNLTGVTSPLPTQLSPTNENATPTGTTVATLLGTTVSDVDAGAVQGIAITGVSSLNGNWQFSTNGGSTYT